MSVERTECDACGGSEVRRLDGGTLVCDGCGRVAFGTCVNCGERDARTSHVVGGDLRPVCYRCKSL